jgi:hypothetical protein
MNVKYEKKGSLQSMKPFQSTAEEAAFWDTHDVTTEINEGTLVGFHQAIKQTP